MNKLSFGPVMTNVGPDVLRQTRQDITNNPYSNRPDHWENLGGPDKNFCLWDPGHYGGTIPIGVFAESPVWDSVDYIFIIDKEVEPQNLIALRSDPRVHVWDGLVVPEESRWHSYFWWWDQVRIYALEHQLLAKIADPRTITPKYTFDCVMGNLRPHRDWVYDYITAKPSLHQKILLNYYANGDDYLSALGWDYPETPRRPNPNRLSVDYVYQDFACSKWYPMRGKERVTLANLLPVNIYQQSWFSIICESRETDCFMTEKTAKPLLGKRLFVLFGAQNTLSDLRKLGFKTFEGILDESYDRIEDDEIRWKMAMEQVEYISAQTPEKIWQRALPILEHNQAHFAKISWLDQMLDEMSTILDK